MSDQTKGEGPIRTEIVALAERIGEDAGRISWREPRWARYLQNGAIVEVHLGRWRATAQTSLRDLGIIAETPAQAAMYERVLNAGSRNLLPPSYIKAGLRIEGQARWNLEKESFKTFWGRWIYEDRYLIWKERNETIRVSYLALAQQIYDTWETLMGEVTRDYLDLAQQAYARLQVARPGFTSLDRETWIARFVAGVLAQIPSRERVLQSYTYDYDVSYVPLQATIAADVADAERVRRVDDEVIRMQAEGVMAEDIRRTEARKSAEGMARFVADLQAAIREQVYETTLNALELLKARGTLPKNTVGGLNNLIEICSSKVFWDDPDLDARIEGMRALIAKPVEDRDPKDVRNALQRLGAEARLVLLELNRTPERSGRDLGIPDNDLEKLERVSRRGDRSLRPLANIAIVGREARGERKVAGL